MGLINELTDEVLQLAEEYQKEIAELYSKKLEGVKYNYQDVRDVYIFNKLTQFEIRLQEAEKK